MRSYSSFGRLSRICLFWVLVHFFVWCLALDMIDMNTSIQQSGGFNSGIFIIFLVDRIQWICNRANLCLLEGSVLCFGATR